MTFTARAASLGTVSTAKLELDPNGYYYMRLKRLQVGWWAVQVRVTRISCTLICCANNHEHTASKPWLLSA
jgi:hypothetical protein